MSKEPWTYKWTHRATRLACDPARDRFALSHGEELYLARLTTCDLVAFLMSHATDVQALLFVDEALWSADREGRIAIARASDGRRVDVFDAGVGSVRAMCRIGPDAVLVCGPEKKARRVDVNTHDTAPLALPANVTAACASADALVLGAIDGRVLLWTDPSRGLDRAPHAISDTPGQGAVRALALSSSCFASARAGAITILSLADGGVLLSAALPEQAACADLAFSPSGDALVAACADGVARVWTRTAEGAWRPSADERPLGAAPDCAAVCVAPALSRDVIVSAHLDAIVRASRLSPREDSVLAQCHFERGYWVDRRDGLNGKNPGMWHSFFPPPDARAQMERRAKETAAVLLAALSGSESPPSPPAPKRDARADGMFSADAETRRGVAESLADSEDPQVVPILERCLLEDSGSYSVEGAFVDGTEWVYPAAAQSLTALYARFPPDDAHAERLRALIASPATDPDRLGPLRAALGNALGARARALVEPLLSHERADVRLRARVLLYEGNALWPELLRDPDEELRCAAVRQHAYTHMLLVRALERYPQEPSARVRMEILDLWLRYQALMGGTPRDYELKVFCADVDAAIRARATAWAAARATKR